MLYMEWYEWLYGVVLILMMVEITKLIRILISRPTLTKETISKYPFISVIIPARNEEERLPYLLEGLRNQDYPSDKLEVIIVNDHSTDRTGEVIDSFQNKIHSLIHLNSDPLPECWSGKSFACYLGSKKAQGEFICFIDADVLPTPMLLREVMAYEEKHPLAALSLSPHQQLVSWAEKILLIPVFTMIAASLRSDEKILNGQFLLFNRTVYDKIGGHSNEEIRNTISEDLGFADFLQKNHYPIDFIFAEHLLSCRMYNGYTSVSNGISRLIVRLMSNDVIKAAWTSVVYFLFALLSFLSVILLISGSLQPETLFMMAIILSMPALLFAISIGLTFYFRIFILYGFLIPFGFLYQPVFFFKSIRGKFRKYYEWRGRKAYN